MITRILIICAVLHLNLMGAEDPIWAKSKKASVTCECDLENFKTIFDYKGQKIEWEGDLLQIIFSCSVKDGEMIFVRSDRKRYDVINLLHLRMDEDDKAVIDVLMTVKSPRHYSLPEASPHVFTKFKTSLPVVVPPYDQSLKKFGIILPTMKQAPEGLENNESFKIQVHTKGKSNDITYDKWEAVAISERDENHIIKDVIEFDQQKDLKILWFSFDDQAKLSILQ